MSRSGGSGSGRGVCGYGRRLKARLFRRRGDDRKPFGDFRTRGDRGGCRARRGQGRTFRDLSVREARPAQGEAARQTPQKVACGQKHCFVCLGGVLFERRTRRSRGGVFGRSRRCGRGRDMLFFRLFSRLRSGGARRCRQAVHTPSMSSADLSARRVLPHRIGDARLSQRRKRGEAGRRSIAFDRRGQRSRVLFLSAALRLCAVRRGVGWQRRRLALRP